MANPSAQPRPRGRCGAAAQGRLRRSEGLSARGSLRSVLLCLALASALAVPACHTTKLEWRSKDEPAWRNWGETVRDGERYYVGVAVSDSVLTERQGRREARMDAVERVAESIETRVMRRAVGRAPKDPPGVVLPPQFRASFRHAIRGVKVKDWYSERWRVDDSLLGGSFTRYKYFVLVAYPQKEFRAMVDRLTAAVESRLEVLLARTLAALYRGKLKDALRHAESAVFRYPQDSRSWWALYQVQKERKAWRAAIAALRQCRVLSAMERERKTVDEALRDARDRFARQLRAEATALAEKRRYAKSLGKLAEAWRAVFDGDLRAEIEDDYFGVLAKEFARRVRDRCHQDRLRRVAVGEFLPEEDRFAPWAKKLRTLFARELQRTADPRVVMREIGKDAARKLVRGDWRAFGPAGDELRRSGEEAVALGVLGERVDLLLGELGPRRTVTVATAPNLVRHAERPDLPLWSRINTAIRPNPKSRFTTRVWTDRRSYKIGEPLRIHFKSQRDGYAYLFNVQTSGGIRLIFPNAQRPDGAVKGGKVYTLPESDLYRIRVKGPSGWEGLRIVTTRKPLDLGALPPGLDTRDAPKDRETFLERLGGRVRRLPADEWAEASWVFHIE